MLRPISLIPLLRNTKVSIVKPIKSLQQAKNVMPHGEFVTYVF